MTLQDLKSKATAGELCLIDQMDKFIRTEEEARMIKLTLEFIGKNPPPSTEDRIFDRDSGQKWLKRFEAHFTDEQKNQAQVR